MAGKTPNKEEIEQKEPEEARPEADPALVRQQLLQQRLNQTNQNIMDLTQKKTMLENMIMEESLQAAEIRGRISENALQNQNR